jgi:hypothetical protein
MVVVAAVAEEALAVEVIASELARHGAMSLGDLLAALVDRTLGSRVLVQEVDFSHESSM